MGIRDLLSGRAHARLTSQLTLPFNPYAAAPEWPQFVFDDILGEEVKNLPIGRKEAISIPAVSKARNLLVATIAKFPLKAIRANADGTDTDVTTEYSWLYRTNSAVSPYERMAWTIDDLFFYGVSLWLLDRGAPSDPNDPTSRRAIINAEWCPRTTWELKIDDAGEWGIYVDGVQIADDRYMLINSPFEGLLTVGQRTLRGARDVEAAWVGRARNPIPLIDLHRTNDELSEAEVTAMVTQWADARTKPNGAIGSTPESIKIDVYGEVEPALMTEGRNAIRTDIGSFVNIRAAMLDGTIGIDSLTYSTKEGERNSFYEFDLPFWTDPVVARASLDDIVPRGTRIRFETYSADNLPVPTGPRVED